MECDIRIKSPTYPMSAEFVIKHMADDTILSLKRKIRDGLCNDQLVESAQKLIYAGHVLEDSKTLAQLQVSRVVLAASCSVVVNALDTRLCHLPSSHRARCQTNRSDSVDYRPELKNVRR